MRVTKSHLQLITIDPATGNYVINYPNAKQLTFSEGGVNRLLLQSSGILYAIGYFNAYKNIATAGLGVPAIYKLTAVKAETAADTNVFTYTPPAVAGVYRASFALDVSAATAATLGFTLSFKDSNGNAISAQVYEFAFTGGSSGTTLVFAGPGNTEASLVFNIDNSATNIVAGLTFTGTSFAGKVTATLEQLA